MLTFNTLLKFYRTFKPESEAKEAAKAYMKLQHKYYRGKK